MSEEGGGIGRRVKVRKVVSEGWKRGGDMFSSLQRRLPTHPPLVQKNESRRDLHPPHRAVTDCHRVWCKEGKEGLEELSGKGGGGEEGVEIGVYELRA